MQPIVYGANVAGTLDTIMIDEMNRALRALPASHIFQVDREMRRYRSCGWKASGYTRIFVAKTHQSTEFLTDMNDESKL
jgi:hypothetical protein